MYSTSDDDNAIVPYFFDFHEITPNPKLKIILKVLFPLSVKLNLAIYRNIHFAALARCFIGDCIKRETTPTENAIFGRVGLDKSKF